MRTINSGENWSLGYEIKAVLLLALGFALVVLDRNVIYPLFPLIAKDLGLNYRDLGMISASLSLFWGTSAMLAGRLSDKVGTKRVLVPAVILFSLLVGFSGLATGLVSLVLLRGLLGIAEGAYQSAGVSATVEASKPSRLGLNVGLEQMSGPLVGMAFCPVFVVWALKVVPSWHWVFVIVLVPGLIIAALQAKVLRPDRPVPATGQAGKFKWRDVMRYRNVLPGALIQACCLSVLVVLSAFMPNYLTDHLKLSLDSMGMALAGLGVGSCVGVVALPALSDRLGRKPVVIGALRGVCIAVGVLMNVGANTLALFLALAAITLFVAGVICIMVGPLAIESVPLELGATATGFIIGIGELIGGAVAPVVTGGVAVHAGIPVIIKIALGIAVVGLVIAALWLREPRHALPAQGAAAQSA
jgi:MFS family permease